MIEETFEKQDAFTAAMIAAFDSGEIPDTYRPYMDWKRGVVDLPSKAQAYKIMDYVSQDLEMVTDIVPAPECEYAHAKVISYLSAISDELSTIINILK